MHRDLSRNHICQGPPPIRLSAAGVEMLQSYTIDSCRSKAIENSELEKARSGEETTHRGEFYDTSRPGERKDKRKVNE